MGYREMVMDAGYDPDSDEGQQMAASLEAEEQRAYEDSQQPDIVPCPKCGGQMWETEDLCDSCKDLGQGGYIEAADAIPHPAEVDWKTYLDIRLARTGDAITLLLGTTGGVMASTFVELMWEKQYWQQRAEEFERRLEHDEPADDPRD